VAAGGIEKLPGYVWLDTPGNVLHVEAARLEFREDASGLIDWCAFP
jgi:hypothetical protein